VNLPISVRTTRIAAHRLSHITLALALFVVGGLLGLYVLVAAKGPDDCAYTKDYLPNYWLFGVGGLSLVAGHLLGRLDPQGPAGTARASAGSKRMAHIALVFVFLLSVVIWFIEALGTAQVAAGTAVGASTPAFEPITFYIRCAMYHDLSSISNGYISGGVIFIVCAVLGHWLWGQE